MILLFSALTVFVIAFIALFEYRSEMVIEFFAEAERRCRANVRKHYAEHELTGIISYEEFYAPLKNKEYTKMVLQLWKWKFESFFPELQK